MRDHDPWIFGVVWSTEQQEEMRRHDRSRRPHQPGAWQAARARPEGGCPSRGVLRRLVHGLVRGRSVAAP
jgi:hypothetical protein